MGGTYYLSEERLTELLKISYAKGYHGYLDLVDSVVSKILEEIAEVRYDPKDTISVASSIWGSIDVGLTTGQDIPVSPEYQLRVPPDGEINLVGDS